MADVIPKATISMLVDLLKTNQLVLFVGAGISRQAPTLDGSDRHLPLWNELANEVGRKFGDDLTNYNGNVLDLFDSIALNNGRGPLEEAIRSAVPHDEFQPSNVHFAIAKLPWDIVVTTNYDNLLDRALHEPNPIVEERDFDWLSREPPARPHLVHLHGNIHTPHTLTWTDYTEWVQNHPRAYSFLQHVALNKTILFVGYSFSDPHLKEGLLHWLQKAMAGRGKRHFAWMWEVSPEQINLLRGQRKIDAFPIVADEEWGAAFEQLGAAAGVPGLVYSRRRKFVGPTTADFDENIAIVNGYKLFFFRNQRQWSSRRLAKESGLDAQILNNVEQVKAISSPNCFKTLARSDLSKIERALGCIGKLEYGNPDDFLAKFIMFYKVNKLSKRRRYGSTRPLDFRPDTKAVVFDFGGTLTRSSSQLSTWERMWTSVGYTTAAAGQYHRRFIAKQITHQQWCDMTATRLAERGFSRSHLRNIIEGIKPIEGLRDTLRALSDQGTALYIVSGSVKEIIVEILGPDLYTLFTQIKANEIRFHQDGTIQSIRGHQYDF
jgi:SIR2-like domain/haloacid dehalogenase-like hydrolase